MGLNYAGDIPFSEMGEVWLQYTEKISQTLHKRAFEEKMTKY